MCCAKFFIQRVEPEHCRACGFAGKKRKEGFMKKALLIVALLLLVTPVMATTTITAVNEGNSVVDGNRTDIIRVDYSTDVDIRAFALDINTEGGPTYDNIRDFHRGESNSPSRPGKGYGIFPSRFRDNIVVTNPNWVDTNYTPIPAWNEPETMQDGNLNSGMGFSKMIVEMGALYDGEANKPALSGTLFRFDVRGYNINSVTDHVTIAANALRGGVVNSDGNTIAATFVGCDLVYPSPGATVPLIVGLDKTVADACIIAAILTVDPPHITSKYSDTVGLNVVIDQNLVAGTSVPYGSAMSYTYSLGRFPAPTQLLYPKWDPDSNLPVYWSQVAGATSYELERSLNGGAYSNVYTGTATFKTESVAVGFYRYQVRAKNADSNSLYTTGTYDCNAYLSTCYRGGNTADANWTNWKDVGRPDCWCKASTAQEPNGSGYQCDGDADGATQGTLDKFRVSGNDLSMLTGNWKKKNSNLTMDPNVILSGKIKITGACADFDHKTQGTLDKFRVSGNDLSVLTGNWKKKDSSSVTATNRLIGNCPR
jgi:hypothetical protein